MEYLIQGLKMKDWKSRERAAASLGEIGHVKAVEPLTQVLNDNNKKVRKAAEEALEKIKVKKR